MNNKICFSGADILLPKDGFEKWAVIACDQYTSEPEYWESVEKTVGDAPSAYRIVFPEVYLGNDDAKRIEDINAAMSDYCKREVFEEYPDSLIYIERIQSDGKLRRGVIGKVDLTCYDFSEKTDATIRATEKTVVERIPPRVKIRGNAPLELPHVMLLTNDTEDIVMKIIDSKKGGFKKLYDFDLMLGAGHIKGYLIDKQTAQDIFCALEKISDDNNGLLFCVGDGNHSLATAKRCYELNPTELSKYALAEFVNIHEEALEFEPIYRVVFGADKTLIDAFVDYCGGEYNGDDAQTYECIAGEETVTVSVKPKSETAVGTLQGFLDEYKETNGIEIDYIHGIDSTKSICDKTGAIGFIFGGIEKRDLFPAVLADGCLPRKTFSMGHAADKRFYIEARRIK